VLGASFDTPADNLRFAQDQGFRYQLLSDVDRTVGAAYEVLRDPSRPYAEYPRRYSYLIDPGGMIRRTYDVTDVAEHAKHVLAELALLQD
jgi:peroxiredoxin Q/BCP